MPFHALTFADSRESCLNLIKAAGLRVQPASKSVRKAIEVSMFDHILASNQLPHEKTNNLHRRKPLFSLHG